MEIGLMSGKQNDDGIKYNEFKSRIGIQKKIELKWIKHKKYEYNGFICNENMATIPRKYNGKCEKRYRFKEIGREDDLEWFVQSRLETRIWSDLYRDFFLFFFLYELLESL